MVFPSAPSLISSVLVELLNLSVKSYQNVTGRSANKLAEESGLLHIALNDSTPRTYLLERYLDPQWMPKPRWALMFNTCDLVMQNFPDISYLEKAISIIRKR